MPLLYTEADTLPEFGLMKLMSVLCVSPNKNCNSDFVPGTLMGPVFGQVPSDGRIPAERSWRAGEPPHTGGEREEGGFRGREALARSHRDRGVAGTASGRPRSPGLEEATSQPSAGRMAVGQEGCRCQLPAANVHRSRAQAGPGVGPGASESLPAAEGMRPASRGPALKPASRTLHSTQSGVLHVPGLLLCLSPGAQWDWRAGRRLGFGAARP